MPLDRTQPFREVRNAMGNVYFEQGGTYYDVFGNVAAVPPFGSYNSPNPQWQYSANGQPLGLSGPAAGLVSVVRVLLQSAIPFILAGGTAGASTNQFTMGNNGAISNLPVLPTTYSGGAFIYMPVNGIFSGSAAGWYWFVASSQTAGTVYNNTYTSGDPKLAVPATPTPFVSTGPGLVTQTTSQIASLQHIVPGNSMGPNGRVDQLARWNAVGTVGKTVSMGFGGPIGLVGTMSGVSAVMGSSLSGGFPIETVNRNSVANQEIFPRSGTGPYGFSGNGAQFATFDTTQDQYAGTTLQLGATTEAVILSAYLCEVRYGA